MVGAGAAVVDGGDLVVGADGEEEGVDACFGHRVDGGAEGLADVATKLGEAVGQIERTATQIADRHPAFSHIPDDRPARGLIVTLEPYYLRQTMRDHLVESDILPIGVVWAHSSSRA